MRMGFCIMSTQQNNEYEKLRIDSLDKEVGILRREVTELKDILWESIAHISCLESQAYESLQWKTVKREK